MVLLFIVMSLEWVRMCHMQQGKLILCSSRKLKLHEKNCPTHDLESGWLCFLCKCEDITCLGSMWMFSLIPKVFNLCLPKIVESMTNKVVRT